MSSDGRPSGAHLATRLQAISLRQLRFFAELADGRYERIRWGALEGEPTDESCGDCGVDPGGLHHVGCEFETCPRCSEALALCDCWAED